MRWRLFPPIIRPTSRVSFLVHRGSRGVSAPHAEVLLFRQKDPKPLAPGRGPPGAFAPVPIAWAAELASLRQSSPPNRVRDWGAATPAGAGRHVPGFDPGWRGYEYLNEYNCLTVESGFWLNSLPGIERVGLCLRHQIHCLRG